MNINSFKSTILETSIFKGTVVDFYTETDLFSGDLQEHVCAIKDKKLTRLQINSANLEEIKEAKHKISVLLKDQENILIINRDMQKIFMTAQNNHHLFELIDKTQYRVVILRQERILSVAEALFPEPKQTNLKGYERDTCDENDMRMGAVDCRIS